MQILALQCYLTTVIWVPPATSKLFSLQPNSFGFLIRIGFPYLLYSAGSGRNVPLRRARSFINTKKTGTRIST